MKYFKKISIVTLLAISCRLDSQQLLEKGKWEVGLFSPVKYGVGAGREVSVLKLSSLKMPNLSFKQHWYYIGDWNVSSRHSIYYPTPLLKWLQSPLGMELGGPDMFALISPEFDIPQMISIWNGGEAVRQINEGVFFTASFNLGIAFGSKDLAQESTIDLPLIFPRLAVYYADYVLKMGTALYSKLNKKWAYKVSGDIFLMPGAPGELAFEHTGQFEWKRHSGFRVLAGYKLIYGEYPFGGQAHLLPAVDLIWHKG